MGGRNESFVDWKLRIGIFWAAVDVKGSIEYGGAWSSNQNQWVSSKSELLSVANSTLWNLGQKIPIMWSISTNSNSGGRC